MFPYSLGFTVEERDPPDGASTNTPFDTAVTFVIVVQQIPVLLVEYKPGQEALRTARGRSKADTQFRDELQEALRVVAKSLPPNVSFPHAVYGISAVGLHVRFYKAYRDTDHQIVVEPPREDQATGSKSRLSPTYLADAWNIRITDPQSVARLADVREHIIDIAKNASLAMDAFVAKMSKRFAAKNPRKRTYEDEDRGERRFPDNVIVETPFEGTELIARADSD